MTAANVEWIRPNTTKYIVGALEPALYQGPTDSDAWDDANQPWNGLCQTCHQNTLWHRNDNSLGAGSHVHNIEPTNDCKGCHPHTDGFRGAGRLPGLSQQAAGDLAFHGHLPPPDRRERPAGRRGR